MLNTKHLVFICVLALFVLALHTVAEVPQLITVQGRLTDSLGNTVSDSDYQITFTIYNDPTGGSTLWSSGQQIVPVARGLFTYQLGSAVQLPDDLFALDTIRYLGITVGSDPEIVPRTRLTSGTYVYHALRADTARIAADIVDRAITGIDISLDADILPEQIWNTAAITEQFPNTFWNINYFTQSTNYSNSVSYTNDNNPDATVNFYNDNMVADVNGFKFYDSTMSVTSDGVRIGDPDDPVSYSALHVARDYNVNSPSSRYGVLTGVENSGTGTLFGTWSKAKRTSPASTDRNTYGVYAYGENQHQIGQAYGVFAKASGGLASYGIWAEASGNYTYAGYFKGDLWVTGVAYKTGGGFKIDHPLDPENKYLVHSFVESPDMKNVYDGVVSLDSHGEAVVELPDYFGVLNKDFRYQLTSIGAPGPNLYIAEKIAANQFKIAGGEPGMEVSWQVTGIRKDPYAETNRIQVEVEKRTHEKGLYLHPELYGFEKEKFIHYDAAKAAEEHAIPMESEQ